MKPDTHPEWYPEAEVVFDGEVVMTVGSTQPRLVVDVWSGTHPFYTGEQRLLDTEGQVDRFMRRLKVQQDLAAAREVEEVKADPRTAEIAVIGLEDRVIESLTEAGFTTVGDLLDVIEDDEDKLLSLTGVGQTVLINIRKHLRMEELID